MQVAFNGIDYIPVEIRLRKLRLTFIGHCWRCRNYSYQAVSDLIFWKINGSGGDKYYDRLLYDVSDNDAIRTVSNLQTFMSKDKQKWHTYVNEETNEYRKKENKKRKPKSS